MKRDRFDAEMGHILCLLDMILFLTSNAQDLHTVVSQGHNKNPVTPSNDRLQLFMGYSSSLSSLFCSNPLGEKGYQ